MPEKSKSRADDIVAAATRLFAERGYDGVSVRDICAELSVNCSIVSYYFNGKKGLYLEVLKRQFKAYDRVLKEATAAGSDPKDKLSAFVGAMGRLRGELPYFSAIVVRECGSPSPEFLQVGREHRNEDFVAALIRDGQRQGQFKKGARAEALAMALTLLLNGSAAARAFGIDAQAEKEYYEAVGLLFDGLTTQPDEEDSQPRLGKQSARPRTNWGR